MSKGSTAGRISLRGVRHNNLKIARLELPLNELIVITGLSGSGKSSLAFDTLFAEGQRRYVETFSPYARQFFDRMDKPRVDHISGIPPAIALEQVNAVRTTRSTVGTMTEICDYLKVIWPHVSELRCRKCARPVRPEPPDRVWSETQRAARVLSEPAASSSPNLGAAETPQGPAPAWDALIAFTVPLSERLSLEESLELIAKQGYSKLLVAAPNSEATNASPAPPGSPAPEQAHPGVSLESAAMRIVPLTEALEPLRARQATSITVSQDTVPVKAGSRARFVDACEQAYHFGKGQLVVHLRRSNDRTGAKQAAGSRLAFSRGLHCATCDVTYREPAASLFSFNHPAGACPACRGFGRVISIDYQRALPDWSKTLAGGVVRPWQTGQGRECQTDLMKFCARRGVSVDVPFARLPADAQRWVMEGDRDYGKDPAHEWPRAWYGVRGYFRWLESRAYKMHVRVQLARYRSYQTCPACHGARLQPDALLFRVADYRGNRSTTPAPRPQPGTLAKPSITLPELYQMPLRAALGFIDALKAAASSSLAEPIQLGLDEVRSRLAYLVEIGLGYLTLDRPTRSLSGGEVERVNVTACLGSRLVNTLFVLDEPSVGLHPRDTTRLVRSLRALQAAGNTVVVVEHEPQVIRAADHVVDLGPGHGHSGGRVVFQGSCSELLRSAKSLTGQYLAGRRRIESPRRRPVENGHPRLVLDRVSHHNLKNLRAELPLRRFVCITGVSGSGKSTLVRDVLYPLLRRQIQTAPPPRPKDAAAVADLEPNDPEESTVLIAAGTEPTLTGYQGLTGVAMVDQSPIGRTPRSNPAVYLSAFDSIRELFAASPAAQRMGLRASAFSFNSRDGQCERCRGAGFEKIEMQFLSDVFVRCPSCDGRRYRQHVLEVTLEPAKKTSRGGARRIKAPPDTSEKPGPRRGGWSIADLLDATVDEAIEFLAGAGPSRAAEAARSRLRWLQEVGLGYLALGQPINTLSGGESQRLKLVRSLADVAGEQPDARQHCLWLFDEPTTGLHFEDVRLLILAIQRLVDAGQSVVVIEHNLELIRCADWIVDLGPDAGDEGGRIVVAGTPEDVAACPASHTGAALRERHAACG
jgi:excinuclease ABC subunit A